MKKYFVAFVLIIAGCTGCTVSSSGIQFNLPNWSNQNKTVVEPKILTHEFRLIILEDLNKRPSLTKTQLDMITGPRLRKFCKANCMKDADGNPQFRLGIQGTPDYLSQHPLPGIWGQLVKDHTPASFPWIILANSKDVLAKPLPTDWAELQVDVEKYAGVAE